MFSKLVTVAGIAAAVFAGFASAVVRGTEPDANDTRLDAVCALTLNEPDFIGIDNYYGSGVLIAPNIVLTARHVTVEIQGGRQGIVSFRRKLDGSVGSIKPGGHDSLHSVTVSAIVVHPDTDFALLYLSEPVTHIQPMRYDLSKFGLQPGEMVYMAGWGSESETLDQISTTRRLTYGRSPLLHTQAYEAYNSKINWIIERGYALSGDPCRTCPPTINLHDSGGAFMRLDPDGQFTLIGTIYGHNNTGLAGGNMLAALSSSLPNDWAFMGYMDASTRTFPDPQMGFSYGRPLGFNSTTYLISRAWASPVPGHLPTVDFRSEPGYSLVLDHPVRTSSPFSFSEATSNALSLDAVDLPVFDCGPTTESRHIHSVVSGTTSFTAIGTGSYIDVDFNAGLYHHGDIGYCDPRFRADAYLATSDHVPGAAAEPDVAVIDIPLEWNYKRLDAGLTVHIETDYYHQVYLSVQEDWDADGVIDFDRSVFTTPSENGWYQEVDYFIRATQYRGQFRFVVHIKEGIRTLRANSPGCDTEGPFQRNLEINTHVTIAPIIGY
ncbi:MAG: trypsin-like serine protease [Phycisphaerales bacterium]